VGITAQVRGPHLLVLLRDSASLSSFLTKLPTAESATANPRIVTTDVQANPVGGEDACRGRRVIVGQAICFARA
jgi:hypothetical protein